MRRPINTPSSPASAPSGGLRPSRLSSRPRFSWECSPSSGQPHLQLARDLALGFARIDLKRAAHHLDEGQERRLLAVGRAVSG